MLPELRPRPAFGSVEPTYTYSFPPVIQLHTLGRVRLLGETSDEAAAPATAQPKRLALLAYLALMSGGGPVRRDVLLALFWPELGEDEARRALRQGLHYLRRLLGEDVLVGAGEELTVSRERFRCDAVEFERLVSAGDPAQALSLYAGDFLAGFFVPDVAPELEEWIERTRTRLRRHAATAAWSAAEAAEADGRVEAAVELGRRGCELEPDQEGWWRRLMALQARVGDRAGALRTYDDLAARLRREFDAEPSAETASLAARLRAERLPDRVPSPGPDSPPVSIPAPGPRTEARQRQVRWVPVVAGAAVVLLATAAVSLRLGEERRREPSLLESGTIAARDRLLIADFTDSGGDTALAAAITDAFRVDFAQSPNVRVMTPRQVRAALERMERSADVAVDDSLARDLAMREGVKAFVVGRVSNIAGRWGVNVELVGAESGEVLAAVRETAADSNGLIDAVDRASEALRHRLGESLRDLRALPPLAQEVTASLPALRKYTEAMRLSFGADRARAIPLFEQAIALDSTFSTAYLSLAYIYGAMSQPGLAEQARQRAMVHLDRLPYHDRLVLLGTDAQARGDAARAIGVYEDYVARFPYSAPAINNLAIAHRYARHYQTAESLWARAIELDSGIIQLYFGLHGAQLLAGKFAESRRTLDHIGRRSPDHPLLLTVEVHDAASQQDWEGAERRAEANIAATQADTLALVDAFEQMAGIVMTQGRLEEAERHWRTHQRLAAASNSWGRRLYGAQMLGRLRLHFRHDSAAARAVVDSALARRPLDSLLPADRPYAELARFFAAAGDPRRARALRALEEKVGLEGPARDAELAWTDGVILLAEGRPGEAEPRFRAAADALWCAICALPDLARARDANSDAEGAIETYERYLSTPWLFRYEVDAYELEPALARLAELYEARGDRVRARDARTRLLALWRRADAELQPVLADVRTRLRVPDR